MNKLMMVASAAMVGAMVTGCATSGLKEEAEKNVPTKLWYDNATLLVDANDPDLKADARTGIPSIDGPLDSVKDIINLVPSWTVSCVEKKHFASTYMESAKALNGGTDGAELVVKGEAFKTVLMMETFAEEAAHANAAATLSGAARTANYAENGKVYDAASKKVVDYANEQIFVFESCGDDASRKAFFADAARKQWDAKTDDIVAKLTACVNGAKDEAAAKANIEKLCREMGVQDVDWKMVALRLAGDLQKLQNASQQVLTALQNPDLAAKIAAASFGVEIVPGTAAKETLAAINRVKNQLAITTRLIGWLIKSVVV